LFVVVYGCETWSLALKEEHRASAYESRVSRRIFGPKRGETTRGWKQLHNEELHNLYSSPNIIRMVTSRRMRWVGHVACIWAKLNVYRILVGKPEGKIPLERPKYRREDNIKMHVGGLGWSSMDWIDPAQDRDQWRALVNTVLHFRIPLKTRKESFE
jgi:hypothetical protein